MKLYSTQFSASSSSCLLRRYILSFNFKLDTEVAGSSILNTLFTLFHITLDLYIKVLSGGGVIIKVFFDHV